MLLAKIQVQKLLSRVKNAKCLQISSCEETNSFTSGMAWGWVHFQQIFISFNTFACNNLMASMPQEKTCIFFNLLLGCASFSHCDWSVQRKRCTKKAVQFFILFYLAYLFIFDDAEKSALHHRNKLHFNIYSNSKQFLIISPYYCFYIFDQINAV